MFDWLKNLFSGNSDQTTPANDNVYWVGTDGNVWFKSPEGVQNVGKPINISDNGFDSNTMSAEAKRIDDPNPQQPQQSQIAPPTASSAAGGGSSVAPAAQVNSVISRINQLNDIYNGLFSPTDRLAADKAGLENTNYNAQLNDLNTGYRQGSNQLANIYGGRGITNSSYYQNAVNDTNNQYNQSLDQLDRGHTQNLSSIGQFDATTKAGYKAIQDQYNNLRSQLPSYSPANLQYFDYNLGNAIAAANSQKAGLGTQSDYVNQLNSVTPLKQTFTDQLNSNLQNLVNSNAPTFAKQQIAKGYINAAGADPNQWYNYFNQLNQQR